MATTDGANQRWHQFDLPGLWINSSGAAMKYRKTARKTPRSHPPYMVRMKGNRTRVDLRHLAWWYDPTIVPAPRGFRGGVKQVTNHPNRNLTDSKIAIIKGMLMRGDAQQSIVACFGGEFNSGRIAEIHNSMTRESKDGEPNLTIRARDISPAPRDTLPPPPPYPSPYEIIRARAALRSSAESIKGMIEKAHTTLAMLDRVLK